GTVTFNPNVTTQPITITLNPDSIDEVNETFNVTLSTPVNAVISDGTGVCTILDDDAPPNMSIDDVSVTEGDTGTTTADFTISLATASGRNVTLNYSTADNTAVAPGDYTAITSGSLTFTPGQTSKTISVTVKGDTLNEDDETFFV